MIVWDSRYNYNDTAGADYDIYSVRSLNLGVTWEAPVPVNLAYTDSGRDDSPVIASNLVDLFIVVWASQDTLGNQLGTDYDVLLSRSIDYGQSWSSPVPVNSEAGDSSKNFVDLSPTVSFLSQYRIIVAWEYWQANSFVNYEIRARVSLNYGYSWRNELTIGESGSNGERSAFSPAVFGDPDTLLQTMVLIMPIYEILIFHRLCGRSCHPHWRPAIKLFSRSLTTEVARGVPLLIHIQAA